MNNSSLQTKLLAALTLLTILLVAARYPRTDQPQPADQPPVVAKSFAPKVFAAPSRISIATQETSDALDQSLLDSDPQKRSIAFGRLLTEWFAHDPEAALAYLRGMPQSAEYTEGLFIILGGFGKSDPLRALTLAREMASTREQQQIYSTLFDQFAHRDITNALGFLELVPAGAARVNALHAFASAWVEQDRAAVLSWAQSLTDPADRNPAMETALYGLAMQDPRQTLSLALQNLTGDALERTAARSFQQMITDNPQAVGDLVNRLPVGPLQTQTAISVARKLAEQEPTAALSWSQTLTSDALRQSALNNVLDLWSAKNPGDSAQFVAQMTAGPDQDVVVNHLAHNLATANSQDAIQWAEALDSASARNAALVSIASGWAESDPVAATRWAQTLPIDSPARAEALNAAFSYWLLLDSAAAQSFAGDNLFAQ
jgi:hypothetical protein